MSEPDRSPLSDDFSESDVESQVNKRLTLNLLIQGAAAHTFLTASHLVSQDLERIHPGLTRIYDRFAISAQLNYCIGEIALTFGRPNRWFGFSSIPQKIFRNHRLMAMHGNSLATAETRRLMKIGWKKWIVVVPVLHWFQCLWLLFKVLWVEQGHSRELSRLAVHATSEIWGIPEERLDGEITKNVAFGNIRRPESFRESIVMRGVAGYGGVMRHGDRMNVVAKAWVFPLLVHELVKGTMELICLHGLCQLDDNIYARVIDRTDRLDYETWMLQAGPELWRRLIAVAPRETPLARTVMHIARLPPQTLEDLMLQLMEQPDLARHTLNDICTREDRDSN